jgi:hypothetical protein
MENLAYGSVGGSVSCMSALGASGTSEGLWLDGNKSRQTKTRSVCNDDLRKEIEKSTVCAVAGVDEEGRLSHPCTLGLSLFPASSSVVQGS